MVLKRFLVVLSILLVVAVLGACVRSASTPPASVVTPPAEQASAEAPGSVPAETSKGQAVPTNEVLQQLALFVTQTAAAGQNQSGEQPGEAVQGATPYPLIETPMASSESAAPAPTQAPEAVQQPAEASPTQSQPAVQAPAPTQPAVQTPAPNQPTKIVVPEATPGIPNNYTLQPGEFVYCIARRFNVNPFELLSINGLSTSSVVRGGTVLKIPQTGNKFPGERSLQAHPTVYVVKGGENIYEIACNFGNVSPDQIALANGLREPWTLTSGQSLDIP